MINQYTYYQRQPMMSPGQIPQGQNQPRMSIRQKIIRDARRMQNIFPRWLTTYPIVTYILALLMVSFMYSSHSMPWYYIVAGVISILVFFLYGSKVVGDNSIDRIRKEKRFERRIFLVAFIPRILFMFLLYWIFQANYGDAFGFENGDAIYYDELGTFLVNQINKGNFHFYDLISKWSGNSNIDDMGYGVYVGFIYWLTDNSIIAVRLLKCLWSSLTVILIYRLAKRNFGDQPARIAAIFCALWPNFWYYCTCHLKEVEMVFLAVLFVEQADQMLRSRQFTAWKVIPVLLIAAAIFTFRTPLGVVALLALIFSVVMSSTKVVSWGKRVIVGALAIVLIISVAGNMIEEKTQNMLEAVQSGAQESNMEWRGERENGNAFAKYAGTAVFAPMIFTLPFPSMVKPYDGQDLQQLLNGGNYIKSIMSCFTIFAIILLLISGKWQEHLLPLSFILGYLLILAMSMFAHSERFHQPVMPIEFMFAAYGLSIAVTKKKYKRWFTYWCALMLVAAISWNWFKMAGRGLS